MAQKKLVMLAIMDGYGINPESYGNAIAAAKKPNLDKIFSKYPYTLISASGESVGLPAGQFGNSEVGHLNIGAGRVVYQSLTRVNIAVRNKELDKMEDKVARGNEVQKVTVTLLRKPRRKTQASSLLAERV